MRRLVLLALLLASGGAYLAFGTRERSRPNVLLVTIDTLRPDAVGLTQGTPAIVEFLGKATRFRRTRTVAPLTLPAHTSMFTGLFPPAHGIRDNVNEPLPSRDRRTFPLLAEQFHDAGYRTAAFVACGVLGEDTGVSGGFDVYDCAGGYDLRYVQSLPGDARVKGAIRFIEGARGPWFVWVHLFDAHSPCLPYAGDERRPATREEDPPYALYLGGARRADAAFEKLVAAAGDAIVVLASDHGESFGEHDETSHGPLCYSATIDALLAVRAPGFAPGSVDGGLRSVADIAPTLRRLGGLPAIPSDGRDLGGPPHGTLVAESLFVSRIHGWGQCFAVTDGEHSLVESGPRLELFDRRSDPMELRPLAGRPPAYEALDRALERYRSGQALVHDGELCASIPAYGQARLSSDGCLPRHENARRLDPRPLLALWTRVDQHVPWMVGMAIERREVAPLEAALRIVDDFQKISPSSPLVPYHRAGVFAAMAEVTGDRSWLRKAASAQVEAVEKGYSREPRIREAIRLAVAAADPEALERLRVALKALGQPVSADVAHALREAIAKVDATVSSAFVGRGR